MSGTPKIPKLLSGRRIFIAILIGLGVSIFLVVKNFDPVAYQAINWTWTSAFWILMSVLMMALRDVGYIWRLRVLSDGELNLKSAFQISMLWEFASAISPGAIGGTAVAVFIMAQEKIKTGKTTAMVLITSLLDEVFYITTVPLILLLAGMDYIFPVFDAGALESVVNETSLRGVFWGGYTVLFAWTLVLFFGIFIKPLVTRKIVVSIFKLPLLTRWKDKAENWGDDLVIASGEFKGKPFKFWLKAYASTFLSWSARFLMVNCLLMAFGPVSDHFLVYGRQLVMWVILLMSFTPGGSGIAEIIFPVFFSEFLPATQIEDGVAFLWRFFSYYPYLIVGALVLPIWLKRVTSYRNQKTAEMPN